MQSLKSAMGGKQSNKPQNFEKTETHVDLQVDSPSPAPLDLLSSSSVICVPGQQLCVTIAGDVHMMSARQSMELPAEDSEAERINAAGVSGWENPVGGCTAGHEEGALAVDPGAERTRDCAGVSVHEAPDGGAPSAALLYHTTSPCHHHTSPWLAPCDLTTL